ncbi:hypothetical protein LJR039_005026 [Pseudorhodoferax sp. LjRoot39]|uniref:hypothetical protein n=1 Tax=Pseudorhodoferax sp. LjRoot39 TaxID=3342328 RepID=UPI003ED08EBF
MNAQQLAAAPFSELLALHNAIADKAAGPKTFSSRPRLLDRIRKVAAAKNINLAKFRQEPTAEVAEAQVQPSAEAVESVAAPTEPEKKPNGMGVGKLAREYLMLPSGWPHQTIADQINTQIPGAKASAASVRWYANKMRKEGIAVPPRRRPAVEAEPC